MLEPYTPVLYSFSKHAYTIIEILKIERGFNKLAPYYNTCCKHVGRSVAVQTRDGRIHRGIVHRVSNSHVFLKPIPRRLGGYGFGYRNRGYGGYGGYGGFDNGWGIALATIAGLALLPFFFLTFSFFLFSL